MLLGVIRWYYVVSMLLVGIYIISVIYVIMCYYVLSMLVGVIFVISVIRCY